MERENVTEKPTAKALFEKQFLAAYKGGSGAITPAIAVRLAWHGQEGRYFQKGFEAGHSSRDTEVSALQSLVGGNLFSHRERNRVLEAIIEDLKRDFEGVGHYLERQAAKEKKA